MLAVRSADRRLSRATTGSGCETEYRRPRSGCAHAHWRRVGSDILSIASQYGKPDRRCDLSRALRLESHRLVFAVLRASHLDTQRQGREAYRSVVMLGMSFSRGLDQAVGCGD